MNKEEIIRKTVQYLKDEHLLADVIGVTTEEIIEEILEHI